jgi:hypothetical protein
MCPSPAELQILDGLQELRRIENLSLPEIREIERRFLEAAPDVRVQQASSDGFGDAWLTCAGTLRKHSEE